MKPHNTRATHPTHAPGRAPALALTLLLLLATVLSLPSTLAASPAESLLTSHRPLVIGHRGYSAFAPENTRASFERALDAGVDLVELDYHHSSDGIPIVIHDGALDRTTDAIAHWGGKDLPVAKRTAAELAGLDAGSWFKPPFPGQHLPPLSAALDLIQARGVTLIERKGGDPATLAQLLTEKRLVNQLVVQAFDWAFLRELHKLLPDQVLGALGPPGSRDGRKLTDAEKTLNHAWLDEIRQVGAKVAVWNRLVDSSSIRQAHDLGLRVWVYTINEPDAAATLLAAGVDGIITDNPAILWRTLALHLPAGKDRTR